MNIRMPMDGDQPSQTYQDGYWVKRNRDEVYRGMWNEEESRILSAGRDGTALQWYARMEDLLAAACDLVAAQSDS